jgi:hypothetical protein
VLLDPTPEQVEAAQEKPYRAGVNGGEKVDTMLTPTNKKGQLISAKPLI